MMWRWIRHDVVLAVHDAQLAQHSGLEGVRDVNTLLAALARPQHLAVYGNAPDTAALAAAYAYAVARNHPFNDANKRTAWVLARLFLADHGLRLLFEATEAIRLMEQVAAGTLDEDTLGQWLRTRQTQTSPPPP